MRAQHYSLLSGTQEVQELDDRVTLLLMEMNRQCSESQVPMSEGLAGSAYC